MHRSADAHHGDAFHAGQERILRRASRFNVVACGRRFGKTALGVSVTAFGWPQCPQGVRWGFDVGWFSPTYKLLDDAWRLARDSFSRIGWLTHVDKQNRRLEMRNGTAIDFWTLLDPDAGRGRRYGLVFIDEAAMARHLEQAWTASIRPTLTDFAGGAMLASTPKGLNYFGRLFRRAEAGAPDWTAHHAPTSENPYIDADEIEAARQDLPERVFAQEYLAQLLEDGGGVFRRVTAAVDSRLLLGEMPPPAETDGREYVIGVDWGRHEDFTVFTVMDATERAAVWIDRMTEIDYRTQLARLRALHARFPESTIVAEANAMGGPLVETLADEGLPIMAFTTTQASKARLIESLALAFERGEVRIPPHQCLIDELMSFEQTRLPSGMLRYGAPTGQHDDCVISLALAWQGAMRPSSLGATTMTTAL